MDIPRHTKYYQRNLTAFPYQYTEYDSSRTSLVYFCIGGLCTLSQPPALPQSQTRESWIEWVYSNLVPSGEGFRGSPTHDLKETSQWDPANMAGTFFSICILALLRDESMSHRLDRHKILEYVSKCQRDDGSFAAMYIDGVPAGDHDPRYTYMAVAISWMLGGGEVTQLNLAKIRQFALSVKNYDGGICDSVGGESHAGLTFCALAGLSLAGLLDADEWVDTASWLAKRQVPVHTQDEGEDGGDGDDYGGFNGRCNKVADTCYAFWSGASLKLLGKSHWVDAELSKDFLLQRTQHKLMGGFGKYEGVPPDPLHSYLGLAALQLQDDTKFHAALCLPAYAVDFLKAFKSDN